MSKCAVSINDIVYTISGDRAPEEIQKIASRVDEEMKKIAEKLPFSSRADIAVLAALGLSEEIFDAAKKEAQEKEDQIAAENRETENKIREYEEKIRELQSKVGEYENNFFDLQMENIKLKDELERLR